MSRRIQALVALYFEGIPFSNQTMAAQQEIEAAMQREFAQLEPALGEDAAFERLVGQYPRLADMARAAGYSTEQADLWRREGPVADLRQVKKQLARQRRRIYGVALLGALSAVQLLWLGYNLWEASGYALFNALYLALLAGLGGLLLRRFVREERAGRDQLYDIQSFSYIRQMHDRYKKRLLNSALFSAWTLSLFTLSALGFWRYGPAKQLAEALFSNVILVEIPIFICAKNWLCFRLTGSRSGWPWRERTQKHLTGMVLLALGYWLASCLPFCLGGRADAFFFPASMVAAGLAGLYNLTLRRRITEQNIVFNKRRGGLIAAGVVLVSGYSFLQRDTWYTQPYINSVPVVEHRSHDIQYDDRTGVYTITADTEDFKILHLTDIHLGGSLFSYRKDLKALKAVYAEIAYTQPDLVIVTGDLCFPMGVMSFSLNNFAPINQFAALMRNTGVPWAFTYGNHDTESIASLSQSDLNEAFKALSFKTSANLLYPYVQPPVTGRNNQLIELRNADGSLNAALFLIDSNAYTGEGLNAYDYIHDDQVEWYADQVRRLNQEAGRSVPSLVFFHIPLQQYREAYRLYEAGDPSVVYFFGENNENMIDKVCCSDYPSKLFDVIKELGSTKAVFCGHDHYNNMSLEYQGVRLTYGMSIDYLAMPGIEEDLDQRGGELITLYPEGRFDIRQIPLESIAPEKKSPFSHRARRRI